jgi:hypothetical protein
MDDAWFHDFTTQRSQQPAPKEKPQQHKRRQSLLQQPVSPP